MSAILGEFEYSNRVKIYWSKSGNIHTVTRHEQLDYEELCFENTEPTTFMTMDFLIAEKKFFGWIKEFIKD